MPRNERLRQHRIARNWRQQEVADQLGIALVTVQRWERGFQQPSAYFRVKLSALFGVSAQELGLLEELSLSEPPEGEATTAKQADAALPDEPAKQQPSSPRPESPWNVPFARNFFFTGRSQLLERLHEQLSHRQRAALSGLGGIGKTQTAIEYAFRYREEYRAVFWVRAESRDTLVSDYIAIAQLLGLPDHDAKEQMQVVASVKRWLQENEGWLLLLDNADDLSALPDFLPREGQGQLLLTTRAQATGTLARSLSVDKMEVSEGIRFLLRRAKLLVEDEPLETVSAATRSAAQQLVEELDGLPLALDQAGAYLEETGCSLSEYLALYGQHRLTLLKRASSLAGDYPHTVASTWTLSFSKVEQANPAAVDVLRVCAFLHPDAIPEEVLTEGAAALGPHLQHVAAEPLLLNEAIQLLRRYSLVKRDAEAKLLHLHRLVQLVLKESMAPAMQRQWAERAVFAVNAAFPAVEYGAWPKCERVLSQALTAAQLIEQYQVNNEEAGRLLYETATYLWERGRYTEAEPLYQRALRIREQQLGPQHPDVGQSLNRLGILYHDQGRYAEAVPFYQRALHIWEQQLGPEHPKVGYPLNNLANLYKDQGMYAEAEPLHQRALHIFEQQLGPEHPNVAQSLSNLANLYESQGKYAEAEPLYQRALRIWEQQLGPEHPNVAQSLNNLAELYYEQGKYVEAESLFQRALAIWEKQLGPEHPFVAHALNGLANLYLEQSKYEQAESLYQRALGIREQQLGPDHSDTAETVHDLARYWEAQGNSEEACTWYTRALAIREQALGAQHLKTTRTRTRLIALLHAMGQHEEAAHLETAQSGQRTHKEERKAHTEE